MKHFSLVALIAIFCGFVGALCFIIYVPLSWYEGEQKLGASITTIAGTDTLSSSRSVINTNFSNLNTELSTIVGTTSISTLTTAANLATVGTITSGTWNATAISVGKGGTGTTTPSSNQVILGNGASGFKTVTGFGSSGQFLTSQGAGTAPVWATSAIDTAISYIWTAHHTFTSLFATSASTTNATTTNLTVTGNTIGIFPKATSTTFTASGTWAKPAGVDKVKVTVVGGGGGSGGGVSQTAGGGGGGGGAYCQAIVSVSGNVTVTVGSAGNSGGNDGAGGNGGNSSFAGDVTVTAAGGTGGGAGSNGGFANGGAGGTCTNANLVSVAGQAGGQGADSGSLQLGGPGGNSVLGFGGFGKMSGTAATGQLYGGGAGASWSQASVSGATGTVMVEWEQTEPY